MFNHDSYPNTLPNWAMILIYFRHAWKQIEIGTLVKAKFERYHINFVFVVKLQDVLYAVLFEVLVVNFISLLFGFLFPRCSTPLHYRLYENFFPIFLKVHNIWKPLMSQPDCYGLSSKKYDPYKIYTLYILLFWFIS